MATSKFTSALIAALLLGAALPLALAAPAARAAESAAPNCTAVGTQPPVASAKSALAQNPGDLPTSFALADAWSDAGCFNEAVQVLQAQVDAHPGSKELDTRLRVAKSLVGEEHYFDNIDRADAEAKLKRASFRCTSLADLDACSEALRLSPNDPALLVAQGDALLRARRPQDALNRYRMASAIAPNQHDVGNKITAAEALLPGASTNATAGTAAQPALVAHSAPSTNTAPSTQLPSASAPVLAHAAARAAHLEAVKSKTAPPVEVASTVSDIPRRYSNAAPEARSH